MTLTYPLEIVCRGCNLGSYRCTAFAMLDTHPNGGQPSYNITQGRGR
jgi:hypothetical protein